MLATNLVGGLAAGATTTATVVATLRTVFATVEVHPVFEPRHADDADNLVIVAHDGPVRALGAVGRCAQQAACSSAAGSTSARNRMLGRSCRAARLIDTQPSTKGLHAGTSPRRIDSA